MSDGYLYPLKSSLIFIQKPILQIRHKDIKYVEFSRIGQGGNQGTGRNFDLTIKMLDQDAGNETFKNIDKKELGALVNYFNGAKIKMRQLDQETGKSKEMEFDEKEFDEELKNSQQVEETKTGEQNATSRSGRRRVPVNMSEL